jgi:DNA helicase-2/ATP-dependent DNA helicase PcrA
MAVGDDSQSIYSFRGADFTQILRFPSEHAPCNLLLLQHNYRSTPPILALADACIRSNIHRFDKVLVPTRCTPSAPKPSLTPTADPDDQAAWIASRVQALLKAGASPSDIAILYRAHNHALPLQLPLAQRAIPFTVRSGTRFFEQPHVKDLTALLRLSINPLDSLSFSRLIRRCDGVGAARASLLWGHLTADAATPDVISARLRHPTFAAAIGPSALPTLTRLLDALSALRSSPHTHPCDLIAIAIQRFCAPLLQDPARAASSPPASSPGAAQPTDAAALLHDLQQVATFAAAHLTLPDLLAAIALHTSADDLTASTSAPKAPPPQVTLSTIHQAKGLEWPIVFIPHLIDGAFPLAASSSSLADIEEERRLLYVAITRARDALFLCYPQSSSALRFTPTHLSRFLRDLPLSLFETP